MLIWVTAPSPIRALVHRSLTVIPLVLLPVRHRDSHGQSLFDTKDSFQRGSPEERRTNVTTIMSRGRGLGFEDEDDACFSSTHAKTARAVGSTLAASSPLPCKKNSTTMGSEGPECLSESRRSDRAYTFVSRPATFSVSFTTLPIFANCLQTSLSVWRHTTRS